MKAGDSREKELLPQSEVERLGVAGGKKCQQGGGPRKPRSGESKHTSGRDVAEDGYSVVRFVGQKSRALTVSTALPTEREVGRPARGARKRNGASRKQAPTAEGGWENPRSMNVAVVLESALAIPGQAP